MRKINKKFVKRFLKSIKGEELFSGLVQTATPIVTSSAVTMLTLYGSITITL